MRFDPGNRGYRAGRVTFVHVPGVIQAEGLIQPHDPAVGVLERVDGGPRSKICHGFAEQACRYGGRRRLRIGPIRQTVPGYPVGDRKAVFINESHVLGGSVGRGSMRPVVRDGAPPVHAWGSYPVCKIRLESIAARTSVS